MPHQQQSNFHSKLSQDFGRKALELFRFIERHHISDAKWSNNLHFNLSLKRLKIFSVSLSVSSSVKGPRAERIIFQTKRSLLSERIRQTIRVIKNIKKDRQEAETALERLVCPQIFDDCRVRFHSAHKHHYDKTREKQKAKMARLTAKEKTTQDKRDKPLVQISKEKEEELKKKWVYNTSSKTLSNRHMHILQKGLAFTPTPHKPPTIDIIVAIETGARQLGLNSDAASGLRSSASKILANLKIPPPNITREERQTIKDLKNDDTISVHPADKGRAAVIMDKEDYHRKV